MTDWEKLLTSLREVPTQDWADGWVNDREIAIPIAEALGIEVPEDPNAYAKYSMSYETYRQHFLGYAKLKSST